VSPVDTWEPQPDNPTPEQIDPAVLTELVAVMDQQSEPYAANELPIAELSDHRYLMTLHKDIWAGIMGDLTDAQIYALIRFFTLVEEHSGWEAGSKSPVVWLCRELKQRSLFPDKELTQWIKGHSANKFLPYGNPLDF